MNIKKCEVCFSEMKVSKSQVARGGGRFCSRKCLGVHFRGAGNPFYGKHHSDESKKKRSQTMDRNDSWCRGENNKNWNGGKTLSSEYVRYSAGDLYRQYEHRAVMANKIGRPLTKNEIVHHVNGDKTDNRPENLEIMTRAEHALAHLPDRRRDSRGGFI